MKAPARGTFRDPAGRLPDAQTAVAARALEPPAEEGRLRRRPVAVPALEEEALSDEAVRAVEEGIADRAAGRTHTSEEVKSQLGI